MDTTHLDRLASFTIDDLPELDTAVLGALELFNTAQLPQISQSFTRPLVVGSGAAMATARVLFRDADAVFASESTYQKKLDTIKVIDGVVLVSSSGAKHAPSIAQYTQERTLPVHLFTNTEDAPAKAFADHVTVFPKNREPYTYNTSTYLGMLLSQTQENSENIHAHITSVVAPLVEQIAKHDAYCLIIPPYLHEVGLLLRIKFDELFGPRVQGRVFTTEAIKHAKTVVPGDELFISFGEENTLWGDPSRRIHIPLPDTAAHGALMAVGYYTIGQIQKVHPPYFKENIVEYTKEISEVFGHDVHPIVE